MEITTDEQNTQTENEFFYSQLQFQQFLVEPDSKNALEGVFNRDLNLTNFNELDIHKARETISLIADLKSWGLNEASGLFIPDLFGLVNTARSRNGFERMALITRNNNNSESATITQKRGGNFLSRLTRRE